MAVLRFHDGQSGAASADADSVSVVVGKEFEVTGPASLTSIWYWNPAGGTGNTTARIGCVHLMTSATTSTIASGPHTFTANARGVWNEFVLPEPLPLVVGQTYRAAIRHPSGRYGAQNNYYGNGAGAAGLTVGVLHAPNSTDALGQDQGSYVYSSSNTAPPTNSFESTEYGVDVTVTTSDGPAEIPTAGTSLPILVDLDATVTAPPATVAQASTSLPVVLDLAPAASAPTATVPTAGVALPVVVDIDASASPPGATIPAAGTSLAVLVDLAPAGSTPTATVPTAGTSVGVAVDLAATAVAPDTNGPGSVEDALHLPVTATVIPSLDISTVIDIDLTTSIDRLDVATAYPSLDVATKVD